MTSLLAACGDDDARAAECARARAEMRPNAEQICQQSGSRGGSSSSWTKGRTATDTASSAGSSARGGFGDSSASSSG